MAAISALETGDLVHIPGHVMLVIGFGRDMPYTIHDIHDRGWLIRRRLNGVAVTPLTPMCVDARHGYIDRMTAIQRVPP